MSSPMNIIITLFIAWVFSFVEDIWFNRLLGYQLSGDAEKKNITEVDAISFFRKRRGRFSWVMLAVGLTLIVSGILFATGVIFCIGYIFWKLQAYREASKTLQFRGHQFRGHET